MGDKGRSNVYYGADLEGALAFQPAGVGWGIKIEVTFITMPTWRAALPPYRVRRHGRAGFPAGREGWGGKERGLLRCRLGGRCSRPLGRAQVIGSFACFCRRGIFRRLRVR